MSASERVLVGVIGAAHGIRGEVRLKSYTEQPAAIKDYGPLETEDRRLRVTIESARLLKDDMLVVRLRGIDDRTAAEGLTNLRLYIARAQLPSAGDDEFYHTDLVGLQAVTAAGTAVGRVVAIQNFGAGDLVEIAPPQGETMLVPFTRVFVPLIDLAAGRLEIAAEALDQPPTNGESSES